MSIARVRVLVCVCARLRIYVYASSSSSGSSSRGSPLPVRRAGMGTKGRWVGGPWSRVITRMLRLRPDQWQLESPCRVSIGRRRMREPDTDHREGSRVAHAGTPVFRDGPVDVAAVVVARSPRFFSIPLACVRARVFTGKTGK